MAITDRIRDALRVLTAPSRAEQAQARAEQAQQWIPGRWASVVFGPGQPVVPIEADREPRSFEYTPGVNLTRVPRVAYGLLSFQQLRTIFQTVTEVQIPAYILVTELLALEPALVNADGEPLSPSRLSRLEWLIAAPDRRLSFHAWLKKFLFNVLVYDAPAVYLERDWLDRVVALHVIDGATIFILVDDLGRIPDPPTPAYTQFIWGQERRMMTRDELWYVPMRPVTWAPYGWSPIDQALPWITLLARILTHEANYYTEGTTPEAIVKAPPNWTPQQVAEFEQLWNEVMRDPAMRRRLRFLPAGAEVADIKRADWPQQLYEAARDNIALCFGVPMSELGKTPGQGLGGKGYLDRMSQAFWRMGIAPLKSYVEGFFNDILTRMGETDARFVLNLPSEGPDPAEKAARLVDAYRAGALTLNEMRAVLGYEPVENGDRHIIQGTQYVIDLSQVVGAVGGPAAGTNGATAASFKGLGVGLDVFKHCGVCPEDRAYYAAPIHEVEAPFPRQGANVTTLAVMCPAGLPPRPAVFKPVILEKPILQRAAGGALAPREEAVYLVDWLMDLRLVPVTYVARLGDLEGSVQHYVRGRGEARDPADYGEYWRQAAGLLDWLTGQFDRHRGNWLTHPDEPDRPVLIDNGLAFSPRRKPASPFIPFARQPLDTRLVLAVERLIRAAEEDDARWRRLVILVGSALAESLLAKARQVAALGRVP